MNKQIVSLETSNLAIEKGYDNDLKLWLYIDENGSQFSSTVKGGLSGKENTFKELELNELIYWLRTTHNLHVSAFREMLGSPYDTKPFYYDNNKWIPNIDDLNITTEGVANMRGYYHDFPHFKTYEQALETGILKALELI